MWSVCRYHPLPAGALLSVEQLKVMHQIVNYILSGTPGRLVTVVLSTTCLNLLCGSQGRPGRLKAFFYKQEMGNTWSSLMASGKESGVTAAVWIQSLVRELPHAMGEALNPPIKK